ncbi:MAG: GTPase Era [Bacteroidetes bacterium]|nr:MAG: GTPase Era [Bacteroidota bacterium]RLD86926.1 MAG: GTPase Era [Bacteroidota bacterium]HHL57340.1 GTPase Era [Bacteroidota bacterium]
MSHKAGFVNIIGYPNVGKSTLMNALVGEKLSIITSKAQTTRHRIMGIVNGDDFQIIYSDTPGIIKDPSYKMHEFMNQYIETALLDADVMLLIHESGQQFMDEGIISRIKKAEVPVVVIINKIDLTGQELVVTEMSEWKSKLPNAEIIPVSALRTFNIPKVFDVILSLLPENPPFFPKDELTDRSVRFFVSEIIREKVFLNYRKEIPYSVEVIVDEYKEEPKLVRISTTVYVERESQKAIILGHMGKSIKKVGTEARKDIEEFIGSKVFLEITVKVNKDWREKENMLKRFGYDH